jgi:hypothetical protein
LWNSHFEHVIILSNSFLQYIYSYKKVLKVKNFFTLDIYKVAWVFARHGGCPGGGVTNSDNDGQGGGGVWKSIIWPDILCEWPLSAVFQHRQSRCLLDCLWFQGAKYALKLSIFQAIFQAIFHWSIVVQDQAILHED